MYTAFKHLHLLTIAITLPLFLLRAYWSMTGSPHLQARWVRVAPHSNDAILLFAAIGMLVVGGLNPLEQPWLMAKITGLLLYIGLGHVALKRRNTPALIAALLAFAYIVTVALTKQPLPGVL